MSPGTRGSLTSINIPSGHQPRPRDGGCGSFAVAGPGSIRAGGRPSGRIVPYRYPVRPHQADSLTYVRPNGSDGSGPARSGPIGGQSRLLQRTGRAVRRVRRPTGEPARAGPSPGRRGWGCSGALCTTGGRFGSLAIRGRPGIMAVRGRRAYGRTPRPQSEGRRMSRNPGPDRPSRRRFLERSAAGLAGAVLGPGLWSPAAGADPPRKLRVAAVVTEFTYRSHAHVILENFLEPYLFNGRRVEPWTEIVGLYVDQFPKGEMARDIARDYGIPIFPTIAEALRAGGGRLAADAVLSIGEHGKYPTNARGQVEYPRKRFFDEIVAEFRRSGATAPVFSDKHLSYRADWATEMVDTARRMGFLLMAGSSVPLAERRPPFELPRDARITEAVSLHGGNLEGYDFHALEVMQSIVEARAGGETGITRRRVPRRRPTLAGGRRGAVVARAGRRRPRDRSRPKASRSAARTRQVGWLRAEGPRDPGDVQGRTPRHDPHRGARRNALALRLQARRRIDAPRDQFLRRSLGEPQPLQGPVARDPAGVPVATAAVPDRADPADVLRARRGHGIAVPGGQVGHHTLPGRGLSAGRLPVLREMGDTWKIVTPGTPQPRGIDTTGRGQTGTKG